jgi:hypothetical protein
MNAPPFFPLRHWKVSLLAVMTVCLLILSAPDIAIAANNSNIKEIGHMSATKNMIGKLSTLDMFEQLQLEKQALRIFAMPQVQAQKAEAEKQFRASPLAKFPDGESRIELAANRFALAAVENAILNDPARPKIMWVIDEARDWYGVQYPASAWGGKNPDNFSRDTVIDGESYYEITGQRLGSGPAQMTLMLYSAFIGTDAQSVEGAPVIASLVDSDMTFAADGSYTITIGPEPATPGSNHLQSGPNAKFIHIRNAFSDWNTQTPDPLRIRRVSGPDAKPLRTDDEIAEFAAGLLKVQVPYWLNFFDKQALNKKGEPNTIDWFVARKGGWGYIGTGRFHLQDDEALIVTVDLLNADYLSIQTSDVWSVTGDYIRRNVNLNKSHAKPNKDGSFTYVVAASDPGVWNWADTVGLHDGGFTLRWQGIKGGKVIAQENAIKDVRLVKIADLRSNLPAETEWTNLAARKKQLADREASYYRRLGH